MVWSEDSGYGSQSRETKLSQRTREPRGLQVLKNNSPVELRK